MEGFTASSNAPLMEHVGSLGASGHTDKFGGAPLISLEFVKCEL